MTAHTRTALLIVRVVGLLLIVYGFMQLANLVLGGFSFLVGKAFFAFFMALLKACIPVAAGYILCSLGRPIAEWLTRDSEE